MMLDSKSRVLVGGSVERIPCPLRLVFYRTLVLDTSVKSFGRILEASTKGSRHDGLGSPAAGPSFWSPGTRRSTPAVFAVLR